MVPALAEGALGAGGSFTGTSRDQPDAFQTLVADLSSLLGPSSGLDSADVNLKGLKKLMEDYVSCEKECKSSISVLGLVWFAGVSSDNVSYIRRLTRISPYNHHQLTPHY